MGLPLEEIEHEKSLEPQFATVRSPAMVSSAGWPKIRGVRIGFAALSSSLIHPLLHRGHTRFTVACNEGACQISRSDGSAKTLTDRRLFHFI
jgi:hypothetical protein